MIMLAALATFAAPETMTEVRTRLLDTTKYDRLTRPSLHMALSADSASGNCSSAEPDQVTTQFWIDHLIVSQKAQEFTLEGFFRATWKDERLKFNGTNDGGRPP